MVSGLVDRGQREVGESFVVGPFGVGTWSLDGTSVGEVITLLETALECGINLLDTADVYGKEFGAVESLLGRAFSASRGLRDRFVLAGKSGIVPGTPYDSSTHHLRTACEATLSRLGVDVIDVFQIHRPDSFTHPGEVADALIVLHEQGKIREVGVSNHSPAQVSALQAHLPLELATIQPELSLTHLDPIYDGTLDQALELGLTTFAWSPLANGRLATGEGVSAELAVVIDDLAQREEVGRGEVALAFVLAHPAAPVALLGTRQPERLRSAVRALGVSLDRTDLYRLIEASTGRPLP